MGLEKSVENYRNFLREGAKERKKIKGIRNILLKLNRYTPFAMPVLGGYLGYEILGDILHHYSREVVDYLMNLEGIESNGECRPFGPISIRTAYKMLGTWTGMTFGWFGGLGLSCKINDLLNPTSKKLQKKFIEENPLLYELQLDSFRIFPRYRKRLKAIKKKKD